MNYTTPQPQVSAIAYVLKNARVNLGLSLKQVSERTKMPEQSISRIESGVGVSRLCTYQLLCTVYNMNPALLMGPLAIPTRQDWKELNERAKQLGIAARRKPEEEKRKRKRRRRLRD